MLVNQKLFVHLNGGIRLPITVQGASRRVLSLSSSDMKATSQREDDGTPLSEQLSSVAGGIVALGKFDALHIGHRELAIQAAKAGTPFLLSFTGMGEVLGWEPRHACTLQTFFFVVGCAESQPIQLEPTNHDWISNWNWIGSDRKFQHPIGSVRLLDGNPEPLDNRPNRTDVSSN